MIEINLLPGTKRKKSAALSGVSLPRFKGMPGVDKWVLFIVAAVIAAPLIVGYLFLGVRAEREELEVAIQQAVQDSARYAELISSAETLEARRDTIAQKLSIIQEIDAGRYTWPHIMDEVSRALPAYTWLTSVFQLSGGNNPRFQIEGRTGNHFALTTFMKELEASPFIGRVTLMSTQQEQVQNKVVNNFVLTASYETPPAELLETVPLFEEGQAMEEPRDGVPATE